jgi:hypothetical protein
MAKSDKQLANMLNTLKCLTINKAKNHVAAIYQEMVRWEYAAKHGGWLHCVTCDKLAHVKAGSFDAGHFVPGRRASVIFHPKNCHPQCKSCNDHGGGMRSEYKDFMIATYGPDDVEALEELGRKDAKFTHEELLVLKLEFMARTKRAKMIVDSL